MFEFIKKNIYLIILFIITLSIGFLTFLTFIDKGFIELSDQNLQILLVLNIVLLVALFVFIFIEIKSAIKTDIDKDGLKSNKKYISHQITERLEKNKNVYFLTPLTKSNFIYADILPYSSNKIKSDIPIYIIQGCISSGRRNFDLLKKILDNTYDSDGNWNSQVKKI